LDSFYFMLHIHLSYSYLASSKWKPYLHTSTDENGRRPDHLWVWHKEAPPKPQASLLAHILNSTVCQQPRSADCRHYRIFLFLPPPWGRAIVCYSWLFWDLLICRYFAGSRTSSAVHSSHNTTEEKVLRLCYSFVLFAANKSLDLNKDGFCFFRL
jgi:hypothetical protein